MSVPGRQRIVIKIGSSSLTNKTGGLSLPKLSRFVEDIATLKKQGHEVILVSSGAVAAGFKALGYPHRPVTIEGKQAAAAVGQGLLMESYNKFLQEQGYVAAQILLTRDDFSKQERYRNAHNTISELLKRGIIPVINENDTISVDELTFGDNDMLSSLVAGFTHSNMLIICTDTNGLYSENPQKNPQAKKLDWIQEITPEIEAIASAEGSQVGTGGMKTKIDAAKIALSLGIEVFIGKRTDKATLMNILHRKGDGTYFLATTQTLKTKKQWIALHSGVQGKLQIDEGAKTALLNEFKSLLVPGILQVYQHFQSGDVIEVIDSDFQVLGRGKVQYSSEEIRDYLQGNKDITFFTNEVIHRDEWVSKREEFVYE